MPRTTAAQAYRAYLGLDIARSEGLIPPDDEELIDYDEKGITDPKCSVCHTTLDPLSYPFSRYNGISGMASGSYDRDRLERPEFSQQAEDIEDIPEKDSYSDRKWTTWSNGRMLQTAMLLHKRL